MFCSVRRYEVQPDQIDILTHRVDTDFCEILEREPGFIAYEVLDCGDGLCVTITTFRDRDGAERSTALAASWVSDALADLDLKRIDSAIGEVKVSRATEAMLYPAHA